MAETVSPARSPTVCVRCDSWAGQRPVSANVRELVVPARRGHWRRSAFTLANCQFDEFDRQTLWTGDGAGDNLR
jgi:hypothetical protein